MTKVRLKLDEIRQEDKRNGLEQVASGADVFVPANPADIGSVKASGERSIVDIITTSTAVG